MKGKNLRRPVFLLLGVPLLGFFCFILISLLVYLVKLYIIFPSQEKAAIASLKNETAGLPGVQIDSLQGWEGEALATLSLNEKGIVFFWYSANHTVAISRISPLNQPVIETEFQCEKKSLSGNRVLAYTTGLIITKDAPLGKYFPFEVKSVRDLVTHYDAIVDVLHTFPKQMQTETIVNQQGTFHLTRNPQAKYSFKLRDDDAVCYTYLR